MENAVRRRDIINRNILRPPRTVQIANWKGTGETVRINAADVASDDLVVAGSEQQFFADEIAAHEDAMFRDTHPTSG